MKAALILFLLFCPILKADDNEKFADVIATAVHTLEASFINISFSVAFQNEKLEIEMVTYDSRSYEDRYLTVSWGLENLKKRVEEHGYPYLLKSLLKDVYETMERNNMHDVWPIKDKRFKFQPI